MIILQIPFQIEIKELSQEYGKFIVEPLQQGYGHTLGIALRRVLLTGLPGSAITTVKIAGIKHQFEPIKGVKEDGVDLLLNLKKVKVAYAGDKPTKLTLSIKRKGEVKASDIKTPGDVKISNPDFVIAHLADDKSKLEIEFQVETGFGYSPAEERKTNSIGVIPIDADFSPVKLVSYKIEETRVGRLTNYDKLTLEVWTDGSTSPEQAVKIASETLISYLNNLINPAKKAPVIDADSSKSRTDSKAGKLSIEELTLPTRIANALIGAGFENVADLISADKTNVAKIRNLGEKSVKVIEVALSEKGISWEE